MVSKTFLELMTGSFEDLFEDLPDERTIMGCKLILTCSACPEAYDVFYTENGEEKQIGYLRLRHGIFYAAYPDYGGEDVYVCRPKGDGIFNADEREEHLTKAVIALLKRHKNLPDQTIIHLLYQEVSDQFGTAKVIGVYSTEELARTKAKMVSKYITFIGEMILDADPKVKD